MLHVNRCKEDGRVVGEYVLSAVAMMHVNVDNGDAFVGVPQQRVLRANRHTL